MNLCLVKRNKEMEIEWKEILSIFFYLELGQTPGDGEGQGGLVCCSPWGRKESDMTGQLNSNNNLEITSMRIHKVFSSQHQ